MDWLLIKSLIAAAIGVALIVHYVITRRKP
jgi:hypothetical protein